MSVTALLVPIPEAEAAALLRDDDTAWATVTARATRLRRRVARVDAVREELHAALFHLWEGSRAPSVLDRLRVFFRQRPPPTLDAPGYDPFVHLFGRSLPVAGRTPLALAERLSALLAADDVAFSTALGADLAALDPRAVALLDTAPASTLDAAPRVAAARARLRRLVTGPGDASAAWHEVVRVEAWSQPIWRLDGEQLSDLLSTLGIAIEVQDARRVFTDAGLPAERATTLPRTLGDFAGAGGFLSPGLVGQLGGALRLNRRKLAKNVRDSGEPEAVVVRQVRLLEEAASYAEREGDALSEAAGVEWHDPDPA